jgi:hypothetical protein
VLGNLVSNYGIGVILEDELLCNLTINVDRIVRMGNVQH